MPESTRRIVTYNSQYSIYRGGPVDSYVRMPRVAGPRAALSRLLVDGERHELEAWALEDELWAPGVLALRLWVPGSAVGVVTSPVIQVDETVLVVPDENLATMADIQVRLSDPRHIPAFVEVHGTPPRRL